VVLAQASGRVTISDAPAKGINIDDEGDETFGLSKPYKSAPSLRGKTIGGAMKLSEPEKYVMDNRLVEGTVSMVVAKPKVGKSTFARNLALAVSRGDDFLGCKTKQGWVEYLALEEREGAIVADFIAMGAKGNEALTIYADNPPKLSDLIQQIRENRPHMVVIDPLIRLVNISDERSYAEVYAKLGPLIEIAKEVNTHILLVHHAGKGEKAAAVDSPLGSTALAGAAHTLFCLRGGNIRTIETVQRSGTPMEKTLLDFDPVTKRLTLEKRTTKPVPDAATKPAKPELDPSGPFLTAVTANPNATFGQLATQLDMTKSKVQWWAKKLGWSKASGLWQSESVRMAA
jgi:hypothetical protein